MFFVHTLTRNVRGLPDRSLDAYGSTKFLDDGYDYDANGNVAAISDGATGRNQRGNRTMSYDGLDRLTAVQSPMYGATGTSYQYDTLDNLRHVVAPGRNHGYCYDATNRLTAIRNGSCSGTVVTSLGYDVQGNLASKAGVAYTFDQGNRLRSVNSPATSYLYDGHGRRFRDYTAASRYSVYSLAGQLLYANSLRGGEQEWYISLNGSLVAIRERDSGTGDILTRYQHTDALGSPVVVTNQSRAVVKRNEYEPYGKLVGAAMEDGPGYTGHMGDAATGLVYMQQRYYDPGIGRFLSTDAVTAYGSGDLRHFNAYTYAYNNPYRFTDLDGRRPGEDEKPPEPPQTTPPPPPPPVDPATIPRRTVATVEGETEQDAAEAARRKIRGLTRRGQQEYCGTICPAPNGGFVVVITTNDAVSACYSDPCAGSSQGDNPTIHNHPPGPVRLTRADEAISNGQRPAGFIFTPTPGFSGNDYQAGPGYLIIGSGFYYQNGPGTDQEVK